VSSPACGLPPALALSAGGKDILLASTPAIEYAKANQYRLVHHSLCYSTDLSDNGEKVTGLRSRRTSPRGPERTLQKISRVRSERYGTQFCIRRVRNVGISSGTTATSGTSPCGAWWDVPSAPIPAGDRGLVLAFGDMDQLLPALKQFVPNPRETIILSGCGHWTQQERSKQVNGAVISFLRSLGWGPRASVPLS